MKTKTIITAIHNGLLKQDLKGYKPKITKTDLTKKAQEAYRDLAKK